MKGLALATPVRIQAWEGDPRTFLFPDNRTPLEGPQTAFGYRTVLSIPQANFLIDLRWRRRTEPRFRGPFFRVLGPQPISAPESRPAGRVADHVEDVLHKFGRRRSPTLRLRMISPEGVMTSNAPMSGAEVRSTEASAPLAG